MVKRPAGPDSALRLVIFDCDGTLVDSQHAIIASMARAFDAHGLEVPANEAIRRVVGLSLTDAIAELHAADETTHHQTLVESYKTAFADARQAGDVEEPLFPGAHEAIATLDAAGYLLGIATGKSRRGLDRTLERHGLQGRFVTLQTADDGPGKPDPGMVQRALRETGVDPGRTTVVGDTTYDITMARNAGAYAVGVGWGYHAANELREAGAHAIVEQFGAVAGAVALLMDQAR